MEKTTSTRIFYIDVARGIALLMVIFGHLRLPFVTTWIYSCHIPVFFFLSGMVFRAYKKDLLTFIKSSAKTLLVPYFILGLGIWIFFTCIYIFDSTPPDFIAPALDNPIQMMINFIVQKHYWTIWFLPCLFIAQIILWIEIRVFQEKKGRIFYLSLIICVCAFLYYRLGGDTLLWNMDTALVAQFFMCLGFLFKNERIFYSVRKIIEAKELTGKKVLLTGGFLLENMLFLALGFKMGGMGLDMSVHLYGLELFTMMSAIFGILFVLSVASILRDCKCLRYLGQNTMLVFAWHSRIMIPVFGYIYMYFGIFQNNEIVMQCLYCLITAAGILGVLLPINFLIKKTKLRIMLGK